MSIQRNRQVVHFCPFRKSFGQKKSNVNYLLSCKPFQCTGVTSDISSNIDVPARCNEMRNLNFQIAFFVCLKLVHFFSFPSVRRSKFVKIFNILNFYLLELFIILKKKNWFRCFTSDMTSSLFPNHLKCLKYHSLKSIEIQRPCFIE